LVQGEFNPNTPTDFLVTPPASTKTANFKGTQLSSQTDAYNTNSQRKFVKTTDGYLHSVYESLGKIWYEVSPDNGATWYIQQDINGNSLPISSSGKQPAIDWYYYDDQTFGRYEQVVIVWQEKSGSSSKIMCAYFHRIYETPVGKMVLADTEEVSTVTGSYSSTNCTPVLGLNTFLHIIYKNGNNGYMILKRGSVNITSGIILSSSTTLAQAGNYAKNPTIAVNKSGLPNIRIAWEGLGLLNSTDIYSAKFNAFNSQLEEITNISSGNGYPVNYSPSISIANGKPVVSWTGFFDGNMHKITGEQDEIMRVRALVKVKGATGWGSFTELGDNVNFVNNNSVTSVAEKTVIVWSQGTSPQSKWIRRDGSSSSNPFSNIGNLSHSGIEHQVTTGTNFDNMTAMVFNKQSVPYYFIKSTTNFSQDPIGGGIEKIGTLEQISYGRSGIINKQGVEFVFNTGDVFVADSSIHFSFVPDTILFNSEQELNTAARTENFWLEEGVGFYFSNLYYVIRQELADSVLTEQDQVNFKIELVKAQNGDVIGTFDNITYNKNNLEKYASMHYLVNTSGIQAGEYYLRLATSVAGDAGYNLSNIQRDEFDLGKLNFVNVLFTGETIPVTYELSQNYPNPFNPATTIRYQLPKDGMVTLKVYDILGAEVATLVNEEKLAGKYEVNFNSSGHSGNVRNLASGVYIYRLQANDFISVKKMVLLK
jgi:hypothetical protein